MINKLPDSQEKHHTNKNNLFKKIIAGAIVLTLSGDQPAEAKTIDPQGFPTEMVAITPGGYTPINENIEQSSVPNYINQAKNGVKKYYPQYEAYFNQIFTKISGLKVQYHNIINGKIHENFDIFADELTTEKDRISTILLVLERIISGNDEFTKSIKNNSNGEDLIEISKEISYDINRQAQLLHKKAENRNNKLKELINYINSSEINTETIGKIIDKIEEYLNLYEIREIKEDTGLQKIIVQYINYTRQIKRTPSITGKKFIDEYNRINSK